MGDAEIFAGTLAGVLCGYWLGWLVTTRIWKVRVDQTLDLCETISKTRDEALALAQRSGKTADDWRRLSDQWEERYMKRYGKEVPAGHIFGPNTTLREFYDRVGISPPDDPQPAQPRQPNDPA